MNKESIISILKNIQATEPELFKELVEEVSQTNPVIRRLSEVLKKE